MTISGVRVSGCLTAAQIVLAVSLVVAVPGVAVAQAVTETEVIADLQEDGFRVVNTGTTLLGRVRITAKGPEGTREVVLNPRNGKVLRDVMIDGAAEVPISVSAAPVVPGSPVEAAIAEPVAAAVDIPEVEVQSMGQAVGQAVGQAEGPDPNGIGVGADAVPDRAADRAADPAADRAPDRAVE